MDTSTKLAVILLISVCQDCAHCMTTQNMSAADDNMTSPAMMSSSTSTPMVVMTTNMTTADQNDTSSMENETMTTNNTMSTSMMSTRSTMATTSTMPSAATSMTPMATSMTPMATSMTPMATSMTPMVTSMTPMTTRMTTTTMMPTTSRTIPILTSRTTMTTKMMSTMAPRVMTTTPCPAQAVPVTAEPSKFGTSGLTAFAIAISLALIFGMALLMVIVQSRCKNSSKEAEKVESRNRQMIPENVLSMPMDNAFGPNVHTVDLEDETEDRTPKGVTGNGLELTTFNNAAPTQSIPQNASTGSLGLTSDPEWLKIEPSSGNPESRQSFTSTDKLLPNEAKVDSRSQGSNESDDGEKTLTDEAQKNLIDEAPEIKLTPPPESDSEEGEDETEI